MIGAITGSLIVILWIILGFGNLLLVILAGFIGYLVAALTGSKKEKNELRTKLTKILQVKE
ncbi:hypothetical protein IV63_GL000357 [Companilactobacillus crustorum]|uniref:DUF2273 domain-containing protein n=4 Tax=Companilactobacillus TaxID=2767879 RepID=A0A837RHC4_9LACO|nr:hypothetical protein BI355_2088 [Companilactobacillus crustorum]KRK41800.1 hypothetical protein FD26_GL001149 [Companilactobacillus crustorum JCM 15951]KRO20664.1 hypothetical protein IV63_GL000357 [Companilactobacillus crustorum]